jgi:hypothetical protein
VWQVLDWNQPAIDFYAKFGARPDAGWMNMYIDTGYDHLSSI